MAELKLVLEEVLERTDDYELMKVRIDGKKELLMFKKITFDLSLDTDEQPITAKRHSNNHLVIFSLVFCESIKRNNRYYSTISLLCNYPTESISTYLKVREKNLAIRARLVKDMLIGFEELLRLKIYIHLEFDELYIHGNRLVVHPRNSLLLLDGPKSFDDYCRDRYKHDSLFFYKIAHLACRIFKYPLYESFSQFMSSKDQILQDPDFSREPDIKKAIQHLTQIKDFNDYHHKAFLDTIRPFTCETNRNPNPQHEDNQQTQMMYKSILINSSLGPKGPENLTQNNLSKLNIKFVESNPYFSDIDTQVSNRSLHQHGEPDQSSSNVDKDRSSDNLMQSIIIHIESLEHNNSAQKPEAHPNILNSSEVIKQQKINPHNQTPAANAPYSHN